ncbi:unnamed protein product [Trichogramma brassicae]|uniref:Uncharacterized protein n=1 Tax=Trichogramma brassicae TaxID=86971 RepID=A0A6H5INA2_9HYME|nr:unnamed protein product [Trichogramma brassicae]
MEFPRSVKEGERERKPTPPLTLHTAHSAQSGALLYVAATLRVERNEQPSFYMDIIMHVYQLPKRKERAELHARELAALYKCEAWKRRRISRISDSKNFAPANYI